MDGRNAYITGCLNCVPALLHPLTNEGVTGCCFLNSNTYEESFWMALEQPVKPLCCIQLFITILAIIRAYVLIKQPEHTTICVHFPNQFTP